MVDQIDIKAKQEKVAQQLGMTSDPLDEIAVFTGTSVPTIVEWLNDPEFNLIVEKYNQARLADVRRLKYARKADRIESYSMELRRIDLVVEARRRSFANIGETEENSVTGGISGLIVHKMKAVGSGDMQQIVDEYEIDNGLMAMGLQVKKQLAQELGDFEPNAGNSGGGTILIQFDGNTDGPEDELANG